MKNDKKDNKSKLIRRFKDKLFNDMIEEFKMIDDDQEEIEEDIDAYTDLYNMSDGSVAVLFMIAKDLLIENRDVEQFKSRLNHIVQICGN